MQGNATSSVHERPPGHRRLAAVGTGAVAVALLLAACGSSSGGTKTGASGKSSFSPIPAGPIKVGGIFPLSGPLAPFGESEMKGEKAVIDAANAAGGVDGHQLQFVSANDQFSPSIAATDAQKMISEGVKVLFSPGTETEAPADVPVFMKAKVPVIFYNPGDTWADAAKWPYYFDTGYTNKEIADGMAKAAKKVGITKVGLASDNSGFGLESASDISASVKALGLPVVSTVSYSQTAVALNTQMQQLKNAGADGLVITGGAGFATAISALKSLHWSPKIVSYTSIYHLPDLAGLTGSSLAANAYSVCDSYCIAPGATIPADIAAQLNAVISRTGAQPDIGIAALQPAANVALFKYAVEKNHSVDGDAIKSALEGIKGQHFVLPGVEWTFSPTNHSGFTTANVQYSTLANGLGPMGVPYAPAGQ
jgi:branched-chain amino acid transport system substrate-binding protein